MKHLHNLSLFLAPMEGLGNLPFRLALSTIGGFDEACTEFIRISTKANIPSLLRFYRPDALGNYPQAIQLMGRDPDLLAEAAFFLSSSSPPRIDLNCGCPSNRVTKAKESDGMEGAGSGLLQNPDLIFAILSSMKKASSVPITVKMRIGFNDDHLFQENLLAAQSAGVAFITLHARTRADGYHAPAQWEYIRRAKEICSIPIIGNGDIFSAKDAIEMVKTTKCDGIMVGRGAARNPWIFHEIRSLFTGEPTLEEREKKKGTGSFFIYFFTTDQFL